MNQDLLSFVIKTLLLKPCGYVGQPGHPVADTSQPSIDCDIVRENAEEMRKFIAERLASNVDAMTDAIMGVIKFNAGMEPEIAFELCDKVVSEYQPVSTNRATSVNHKFGALTVMLSYCNHSLTPPMMNQFGNPAVAPNGQYGDPSMAYVTQLQHITNNLQLNIQKFIHEMLSPDMYSPSAILRDCESEVVILHDCPDKDKLRSVADEKNMVVLTATTETNPDRPELILLSMINAYNSSSVDNSYLFPKGDQVRHKWDEDGHHQWVEHTSHEWTSVFNYLAVEKYINDTDGIRDELSRKAPEFLKDFDEDLAAIHSKSEE